ncbi:hypothetical protein OG963_43610 (plasmid) [Streptomyces sp. NBC_01707]|uniref:hypothetical protein n=1 Tax=Streptomyces sp. NBC_01707 TaxID=2975914 RepID=UPI002F91A551
MLPQAVKAGLFMILAGDLASGKTTLLRALGPAYRSGNPHRVALPRVMVGEF